MFYEYFDNFPYLLWNENGKEFLLQDITIRIVINDDALYDKKFFYDVYITDSDTAEQMAQELYGDYRLAWIILFVNKMFDRDFDWPMTSNQFSDYIIEKYGSAYVANTLVKYFVFINNSEWVEVDYEQYLTFPPEKRKMKTLYEIEQEKNENKRKIKILKNKYIGELINKFDERLRIK